MEKLIIKAMKYAEKMHNGQKRDYPNDEDYVNHPKAVAEIVKSMGLADKYVVAAILHDVVEDTKATINDIESQFGREIAEIVAVLTKGNDKEKYVQRFLACDENIALVKLADVYNNSQNLVHLPKEKQDKAKYFIDKYYLPIAKKLSKDLYEKIKKNIEKLD